MAAPLLLLLAFSFGAPIVLLHGMDTVSPKAPFLDLLSKHAEVIAPSSPGFGNSPRSTDFDTMYDLVHLYLALLDQLPYEKVTLMGLSFGGWLAAEVAAASCHRIANLILVDPLGIKIGGREERDIVHFFNTDPAELARRAWHDPARRPNGVHGLGWQATIDEAMTDQEMIGLARNWDSLCLYGWSPHMFNPRLKHWLHRISVPTMVLWGASDGIVTPEYGRGYADLITHAEYSLIDDAGHHPELEQPDAFAAEVIRFLDSTR